jgi:hypothetical protein
MGFPTSVKSLKEFLYYSLQSMFFTITFHWEGWMFQKWNVSHWGEKKTLALVSIAFFKTPTLLFIFFPNGYLLGKKLKLNILWGFMH